MKRCSLLFISSVLAAQEATVIQNAMVYTATKPAFVGSVAFTGGKITAVGEKVVVPPGARVIDGTGLHVSPGIIDSHSHIAVAGFGVNEGSVSVSSMVQIRDVLDAEDVAIYRALAGGVTTANILHGSANAIGGNNQLIKMRWGQTAAGLLMEGGTHSIKFALGENPKRQGNVTPQQGGGVARYPATRMGVEDIYRQAFTEARAYQRAIADFKAGKTMMAPRRDLKLEPLVEVLEGKRLVHCHAYRSDEMLMMMRVAEEFGFRLATFQHVQEGYKIAKEMVQHGVAGAGFSDWWSYKMEVVDGIPYNMTIMTKKGVLTGVNSDDAGLMRRLNTEAAKSIRYGGLTEEQALALVTINPAKQMKVDNLIGSIEPGKSADLVIWNKPPLSSYAVAQKVFIDGTLYFDRDKDMSDRGRRAAAKKAIEDQLKLEAPPEQKKGGPPGRQPGSRGPATEEIAQ